MMKPDWQHWPKTHQGKGRSWTQNADDAFRVIAAFEGAGVRVPPQCRLTQFAQELEWWARWTPDAGFPSPTRLRRIGQARHDLLDLRLIVSQFRSQLSSPPVVERLRWLISDTVLPSDSGSQSKGRDHQFELFIAAIYKAAGAQVVLAEPDVIVRLSGCNVAIAAKRLKSFKKLLTRVRDASAQIEASRLPGIIFLDMERAINANGEPPELPADEYLPRVSRWAGRFWDRWLRPMCDVINGEYVISFGLSVRFPVQSSDPTMKTIDYFSGHPALNSPPVRDRIYGLMMKHFINGINARGRTTRLS